MHRIKRDYISSISGWSVGNSEKARKDAAAIQKAVSSVRSPATTNIEKSFISEARIADTVAIYFSEPKFSNFSIVRECEIQIGAASYRVNIVLRDAEGNFIAIAECKSLRGSNCGPEPLKSFLCATDTPFGIFASDINRNSWRFYENLRHNRFRQIEKSDFEKRILECLKN